VKTAKVSIAYGKVAAKAVKITAMYCKESVPRRSSHCNVIFTARYSITVYISIINYNSSINCDEL